MPRLSIYKPEKGNDYKFFDRTINEMFQVGGTDLFFHKYLGPYDQGDTNKDGIPGDNLMVEYRSPLLSDYDTSGTIDLIDMALFVHSWEEKTIINELGPFTGTVPYLTIRPDNKFNIEDLMAFTLIGNWYLDNVSSIAGRWENSGPEISVLQIKDHISIDVPEGVAAMEIQLSFDPSILNVKTPIVDSDIKFSRQDLEIGYFTFTTATKGLSKINIPLHFINQSESLPTEISVRSVDINGNIVSQATNTILLENIPTKYKLYENYPNPFNPITTIRYDLPDETNVKLIIYDIMGREVIRLADETQLPGYKSVVWKGTNKSNQQVSTGIYFYQIITPQFSKTRKMVYLK